MDTATLEPQAADVRPIDSEEEVYFSASAGLQICINPGRLAPGEGGNMMRVGHKLVAFSPQANGFGRLITSDPEVKASLRKRTDVFDTAEYERRSTPPEIREKILRERNSQQERTIQENNALIAKLQAEKKLPSPK